MKHPELACGCETETAGSTSTSTSTSTVGGCLPPTHRSWSDESDLPPGQGRSIGNTVQAQYSTVLYSGSYPHGAELRGELGTAVLYVAYDCKVSGPLVFFSPTPPPSPTLFPWSSWLCALLAFIRDDKLNRPDSRDNTVERIPHRTVHYLSPGPFLVVSELWYQAAACRLSVWLAG